MDTFGLLASDYGTHVVENPNSFLVSILGAFQVRLGHDNLRQSEIVNVLVMRSALPQPDISRCIVKDIKGKMTDDLAPMDVALPANSSGIIMRDLNQRMRLVDYSMLVTQQPSGEVVLCIIDFLTTYGALKRVEHAWKGRILGQKDPTILSVSKYRNRFEKAMKVVFPSLAPMEQLGPGLVEQQEEEINTEEWEIS